MSDLNDTQLILGDEENGKHQRRLMDLINELQDSVIDMKQAFVVALDQLKTVSSEDVSLRKTVENNKADAQEQAAQALKLVLSFKSEFAWVRSALESSQKQSANLARIVQRMERDRDALLDELVSCGALSQHVRDRLNSPSSGVRYVRPELSSSSGAPSSSDSGVAHLLERAHVAFSITPHPAPIYASSEGSQEKGQTNQPLEGKSSLPWSLEGSGSGAGDSGQVSTLVRDYVAGLVSGKGATVSEEWEDRKVPDYAGDPRGTPSPDSDSSLSRAITKSLSLSTSLGRQCGLELDQSGSVSSSAEQQSHLPNSVGPAKDSSSVRSMHTSSDSNTESSRMPTTLPKYVIGGRIDGCSFCGIFDVSSNKNKPETSTVLKKSNNEIRRTCPNFSDEGDFENKRRLLVLELIESERCYCATLHTLKQAFVEPLSAKDILSPKDVDTLFPREVEELHQQHTSLLTMLEDSMDKLGNKEQKSVGTILRHFIEPEGLDALRLYTSYVDNFPDALQTFHKLCRCSPEFTIFLKDCLESPVCGGLDLGGFLLTPVQRLPHLVLVLRRLLAVTPQQHCDWAPISFSITRLATFLSRLNDSMEHSFQLVAAQIGAPSDKEDADFGHSDNFDESVGGESTGNEDGAGMLYDLTSEGENGLDMKDNQAQPTTALNSHTKDAPESCSAGFRRRIGISPEWENIRPISGSSCTGESLTPGRVSAPKAAGIQTIPKREMAVDVTREMQKTCRREDCQSKLVGCNCMRRERDAARGMKKYSRLCSIRSKEGISSPDLSNTESRGHCSSFGSSSAWAVTDYQQREVEQGIRLSRSDRVDDSIQCVDRVHHIKQRCVHDCSTGCITIQKRRGTSLPRRGCSSDIGRCVHSPGRSSRERETSSEDETDSRNKHYVSSAHQRNMQNIQQTSRKGKIKRKFFKTSKSMHDVPNTGSEIYGDGKSRHNDTGKERHSSGDSTTVMTKFAIARSADDLSLKGSLSPKEGVCSGTVLVDGEDEVGRGEGSVERQLMYTARMLRCSSLEVATMEKLCKQADKESSDARCITKEDADCRKKAKNKKMSLRASIKNMLTFKRRYVRDESPRESMGTKSKEMYSGPVPMIAFGCPYKVDENLQSLITKLNRMPTYIQLVIFCLKETSV